MWNIPTKERLDKIPRLYETENIALKDKKVFLHFFMANCDWYICEFDGDALFFGFAILGGDLQNAEWGYISFGELKELKINGWHGCLEVDCELEDIWKVREAIEVDKIRIAQGWLIENEEQRKCSKEEELRMKIRARHFEDFQDLFAEVTSPYSDFFGIDPYPIWKEAGNAAVKLS